MPPWSVELTAGRRLTSVGPVAEIDPADLPQAPNITHAGPRQYGELPAVMAGSDVALMPFALNDATRSISPTKALEYLAAGLPVICTRVPDVVAYYTGIGAGPTGLGAGYRLQELGYDDWGILEANDYVAGLATSFTDNAGLDGAPLHPLPVPEQRAQPRAPDGVRLRGRTEATLGQLGPRMTR